MFLQTSIARNAYVTGSVHRQSVRIPSMIKNASESIAHGASGHAACISLTRNDTIDVEDCRLAAQLADRGAVTSRVAVDEGIPSCTRRTRDSAHRAHPSRRSPRSVNIKNADECIQLYPAALKARHACG